MRSSWSGHILVKMYRVKYLNRLFRNHDKLSQAILSVQKTQEWRDRYFMVKQALMPLEEDPDVLEYACT